MTGRISRSAHGATVVALVVLGGLVTGGLAGALTLLLHAVGLLAFGLVSEPDLTLDAYGSGPLEWVRRFAGPVLGGALAGLCWWALRRREPGPRVSAMIAATEPGTGGEQPGARRVWPRAVIDAATQILLVGAGASIGREAAPRLAAAGALHDLAIWRGLPAPLRRVLIASAAGAGLAAVYNVPLAGVVFTMTVLLASPASGAEPDMRGAAVRRASRLLALFGTGWSRTAVLVAAPMCLIATVVAWTVVGTGPRVRMPEEAWSWWSPVTAVVGGATAGALGWGFSWLARRASSRATRPGPLLPIGIAGVGVGVAVASAWLPVAGNGLLQLRLALADAAPIGLLLAYVAVKPLLTASYLRAGAVGGLLMPSLSIGAALGAAIAIATDQPVAAIALICAVGVLAGAERSWLFAAAIGWEATHASLAVGLCLVVAGIVAHLTARLVDTLIVAVPRLTGPR